MIDKFLDHSPNIPNWLITSVLTSKSLNRYFDVIIKLSTWRQFLVFLVYRTRRINKGFSPIRMCIIVHYFFIIIFYVVYVYMLWAFHTFVFYVM